MGAAPAGGDVGQVEEFADYVVGTAGFGEGCVSEAGSAQSDIHGVLSRPLGDVWGLVVGWIRGGGVLGCVNVRAEGVDEFDVRFGEGRAPVGWLGGEHYVSRKFLGESGKGGEGRESIRG